jgi:YD repeat-containing protein
MDTSTPADYHAAGRLAAHFDRIERRLDTTP